MARARIGKLVYSSKPRKKSSDDETIVFDGLSREVSYHCRKGKSRFSITRNSAKQINRDARKSILEIRHEVKNSHKLNLVVDLSHLYEEKFHFNLTDDSKAATKRCGTCKKYFGGLNHLTFSPKVDKPPIVDVDELWIVIQSELNSFFNRYKYYTYDRTLR